jgi:hypothetical protein
MAIVLFDLKLIIKNSVPIQFSEERLGRFSAFVTRGPHIIPLLTVNKPQKTITAYRDTCSLQKIADLIEIFRQGGYSVRIADYS